MKTQNQPVHRTARQGFVLLAILVFILLLSMISISLLFRSKGDETASNAASGAEQAWSAAMSGVEEAMRVAASSQAGSTDWQDDPSLFRAREVYQDGADQWCFTIFSPAESDSLVEVRYGLSDEAGRLNLNHPGEADLTRIPRITPALSTALHQFIGQDFQPSTTNAIPGVVEIEIPSHGPLATLDELLLLPGMTRSLLHGAPPGSNDSLVPTTSSDNRQMPTETTTTKRDRGLDQYLTVVSRDPNRSNAGQPRCNLNDPNDPLPAVDLPAGFSNYVAALRITKGRLAHASEALEATVKAPDERGIEVEVSSGITKENLNLLLDLFATDKESGHDGLINVNTASATVLTTLPGIDRPLAESIVSTRTGLSPERRATIVWLYQEGLVEAEKFKAIAPQLTARSTQFRFNVIGYGLTSGRYRVLEAVVDLAGTDPRIVYLRDITRLGLPINLKEENTANPDGKAAYLRAPGSGSRNNSNG